MSYQPVIPNDDFEIYDEVSYMREAIVQDICEYDIHRPTHNIKCRKREIQEQSLKLKNGKCCVREFISPN